MYRPLLQAHRTALLYAPIVITGTPNSLYLTGDASQSDFLSGRQAAAIHSIMIAKSETSKVMVKKAPMYCAKYVNIMKPA